MSLLHRTLSPFKVHAFISGQAEAQAITEQNLLGKWSILMFYPADFTFVCPTELEDLAEQAPAFEAMGVQIMSVSTDTHFTHKAWHEHSEAVGKVRFAMIGDPTGQLARQLEVYDEATGLAQRGTFVLDPEGRVKIFEVHDDGIGRNAQELLRKVKAAQYVAAHPNEACPAKWKEGERTLTPSLDLVGKI